MIVTETDNYQNEFARFCEERSVDTPIWLKNLHQNGLDRFTELQLPTSRDEEWRFTNVGPLVQKRYATAAVAPVIDAQAIEELVTQAALDDEFHRLVFVNGRYNDAWSHRHPLPTGVAVESLATAIEQHADSLERQLAHYAEYRNTAFTALNTAFIHDGTHISIPDSTTIDRPIQLIFVSAGEREASLVSHPRNLISVGNGSQATLIESYCGLNESEYFTNAVTEVHLAESAFLDHYKLQQEGRNAVHVATTQIAQQAGSRYRSHYLSFGAALARNELNCVLDGEDIHCSLNGLYMPSGSQHMDCRTRIDHAQPNCSSHELYKGILDDNAKGVFNGKIYVHPDAQKTDAKQSNQALLLSDDAVIDTKPQLEIYADDVKCTHGATVGELDQHSLYYLRSRGISRELARSILIFAFTNEAVQEVSVDAIRRYLDDVLLKDQVLPEL